MMLDMKSNISYIVSSKQDIKANTMSFREKSAWIMILSMLGVYGFYFGTLSRVAAAGRADSFHYGSLLAETVFALVIVQIVLTVVIAVFNPRDAKTPRDEREQMIALKSTRFAFYVLSSGALCVCLYAAFYPSGFYIVNGLLFVLVLSEVARAAGSIALYRTNG
jgi:uncharacterized membrane protein